MKVQAPEKNLAARKLKKRAGGSTWILTRTDEPDKLELLEKERGASEIHKGIRGFSQVW